MEQPCPSEAVELVEQKSTACVSRPAPERDLAPVSSHAKAQPVLEAVAVEGASSQTTLERNNVVSASMLGPQAQTGQPAECKDDVMLKEQPHGTLISVALRAAVVQDDILSKEQPQHTSVSGAELARQTAVAEDELLSKGQPQGTLLSAATDARPHGASLSKLDTSQSHAAESDGHSEGIDQSGTQTHNQCPSQRSGVDSSCQEASSQSLTASPGCHGVQDVFVLALARFS
eukprot:5620234-Amphidinium_carterae.1